MWKIRYQVLFSFYEREKIISGVADEVESYPCSFCQDSVFLTHYGLERHAKQKHAEHFDSVSFKGLNERFVYRLWKKLKKYRKNGSVGKRNGIE